MGAIRKQGPSGCPAEQVFGEVDAQTGCDPDFHIDGLMAGEKEWDWNDGGNGELLGVSVPGGVCPSPSPSGASGDPSSPGRPQCVGWAQPGST